ncbi:GNAT family N-acetyltransferase [Phreatobacter stygius]|uniref:GNAT family N-acetyltransferase n=1 Tax=Phreatobacter stygius TaxID=1940610 RepID=A0A4D7B882_9HYPH|nr:GNAT family N-acetyltransferase [Phreatobacter stygius]
MASMPLTLVAPGLDQLESYVDALRRGWSPNNVRDVSGEQLAAFDKDPAAFLASLTSREGLIPLPDGSQVPKLPFILRWLWDGAFCGSISLRWQEGTDALPDHVLGHIGYAVVPWKRRRGYATAALAAMLPEARRIGLGRVEITCDPDNAVSMRVIEANGGVLAERFTARHYGDKPELRYVIPLRPTLTTERLMLTAIGAGDFDTLATLTGHPEVGGKLKHGVLDAAQTRAQLDLYLKTWAEHGFGLFVMRRRDDRAFVGIAGLWQHDDDLGVALRYAVMPDQRGQGFTKEAVRAVLDFAATRRLGPIIAVTRETNAASRKILTDLGFELSAVRERPDRRSLIYSKAQQDGS